MRRVRAHDKKDGQLIALVHAREINEGTRYAHDYKCQYTGCDCTMHWRKAVYAKGNTDPIPATFAKNKSSQHRGNCPGDYERIWRENIEYTSLKGGQIHVRINFPLGSSKQDRYPARGYLTEQQLTAAHNAKEIKPYSTMKDLIKFLEKNFETIDSTGAGDVVVNYQGHQTEWRKLFKGSDQYKELFIRARNYTEEADGSRTPSVVTIVNPTHEISKNKNGKRRFDCEPQDVIINGRKQRVTPVICCDGDPTLAAKVIEAIQNRTPMAIAARPFTPGFDSMPSRFGNQRITLTVHLPAQLESVASPYWKLSHKPENQLALFPQPMRQFAAE